MHVRSLRLDAAPAVPSLDDAHRIGQSCRRQTCTAESTGSVPRCQPTGIGRVLPLPHLDFYEDQPPDPAFTMVTGKPGSDFVVANYASSSIWTSSTLVALLGHCPRRFTCRQFRHHRSSPAEVAVVCPPPHHPASATIERARRFGGHATPLCSPGASLRVSGVGRGSMPPRAAGHTSCHLLILSAWTLRHLLNIPTINLSGHSVAPFIALAASRPSSSNARSSSASSCWTPASERRGRRRAAGCASLAGCHALRPAPRPRHGHPS